MPDVHKDTETIDVTSPGLPRGARFGACVGLFAGAAVGRFCCWLVGQLVGAILDRIYESSLRRNGN